MQPVWIVKQPKTFGRLKVNHSNLWILDDYLDDPPASQQANPAKQFFNEVWQFGVLLLSLYLILNILVPRYEVEGSSMEPSFYNHQRVIVSRLHYLVTDPARGDIIVFRYDDENLIKRVIGLPGETVTLQQGHVYINGQLLEEDYISDYCRIGTCRNSTWELGPDEYFVLGDNRPNSNDSHNFGPIHRDQIIGKVILRYWPMSALHEYLY